MDFSQIELKLANKVLYESIQQINNLPSKKLVYTSFDGDYMNFLPAMLNFVMSNKYIPINPESTLGYYVSTTTHDGNKVPVMKDCIKAEILCDEMWIFNPKSSHIPEGVLAEMIVWLKEKRLPITIIPFFDEHKLLVDQFSSLNEINKRMLLPEDIEKYIEERNPLDVYQINEKLLDTDYPIATYVVANFYNFKHIDWARAYCYKNNICPVSPQNIIPYSLYYQDKSSDVVNNYMKDRLTLLDKCDNLIWFTNTKKLDEEIENLDSFSCTELYYFAFKYGAEKIKIVDWSVAGVPKYFAPEKWALTLTETKEVDDVYDKISGDEIYDLARTAIISYEEKIQNNYNIFKGDLLEKNVCEMLKNSGNAFIFGLISDQSVKAELAWSLPYNLSLRLGHFDMNKIAEDDISNIEGLIKTKPALHRYPSNIAKYLKSASQLIVSKYDGDASNIWKNATADTIVKRLEEFKGISHKKAALGSLLLVRDLGVEIEDTENINLAYDIHIRRICLRTGFACADTLEEIFSVGRKIFPEFPGRLTSSFWAIGRDICRPHNPDCTKCPLDRICAHNIELGREIHA